MEFLIEPAAEIFLWGGDKLELLPDSGSDFKVDFVEISRK